MMKSKALFVTVLFLFNSVSFAEIYSWTDQAGTIHFTEDISTVPVKLRNTVRKVSEIEQPRPDTRTNAGVQPDASAAGAAEMQSPGDTYDGKSYEQWQQELADSEAALIVVRRRIDELADQLKYARPKSEEQQSLFAEYNPLLEEFKAMKAEYYQLVAAARKAGLTVNIQEQ